MGGPTLSHQQQLLPYSECIKGPPLDLFRNTLLPKNSSRLTILLLMGPSWISVTFPAWRPCPQHHPHASHPLPYSGGKGPTGPMWCQPSQEKMNVRELATPGATQSETGVIPRQGQHTSSYRMTPLQDQLTVWARTTDWKSLGHRDQSTKSFSAL